MQDENGVAEKEIIESDTDAVDISKLLEAVNTRVYDDHEDLLRKDQPFEKVSSFFDNFPNICIRHKTFCEPCDFLLTHISFHSLRRDSIPSPGVVSAFSTVYRPPELHTGPSAGVA